MPSEKIQDTLGHGHSPPSTSPCVPTPVSSHEQSNEKWNEKDSQDFLKYGAAFIPERETQYRIICDLVASVVKNGQVLELCCGSGDLARSMLQKNKNIHLVAIDSSPTMLSSAKAVCSDFTPRLSIREADIGTEDGVTRYRDLDAVYSSLAIHHLADSQKRYLFRQIQRALRPGGIFVYADMTRPSTAAGFSIAATEWEDEVRQRSQYLYGDNRALQSFNELSWNYYLNPQGDPSDKPSTLMEITRWLEEAAFSRIDIHWFKAAHVVLSAVKAD